MTETGDALRAAIWRDPTDVEAYRVYADWLLQHGSSQGELIQLRLADDPDGTRARRAATILDRDRAKWLGKARPHLRSWTNDRFGFVETAVCSGQALPDGWQALLEIGPRLRLTVEALQKRRRGTVAALAKLPLGRFHALSLSTQLDDRDLDALAPALAGILHLDLGFNKFTGVGLRRVGAHVAGVRTLSVISYYYRPDWVDAIVEAPGFASLESVDVRGTDLLRQVPDADQLARLQTMPAMRQVNAHRQGLTVPMDPAGFTAGR